MGLLPSPVDPRPELNNAAPSLPLRYGAFGTTTGCSVPAVRHSETGSMGSIQEGRANQGAAGVDGQSIADFEADLSNNLYKPKDDGRTRPLGIPTVADRIAQMVVKRYLEPLVEPHFHDDSYGYRPGKSALDAVGVARRRCWRYDWVLDLDIKSFFDDIDRELLMRAVRKHTDCPWVLVYLERWLRAPVLMADGRPRHGTKAG
jgi:retron-type reverse transcriptase